MTDHSESVRPATDEQIERWSQEFGRYPVAAQWDSLAVEQLIARIDQQAARIAEMNCEINVRKNKCDDWKKRAEKAERERDELDEILGEAIGDTKTRQTMKDQRDALAALLWEGVRLGVVPDPGSAPPKSREHTEVIVWGRKVREVLHDPRKRKQ